MSDAPASLQQCVILVGGLGTRLGSLTQGLPKPMSAVGGKPFLAYLLSRAHRLGFSRILLLAGHRAEKIVENLDALRAAAGLAHQRLEIQVVVEPDPRGTAGALRYAAEWFDECFLLLNGDSLFDFNWRDMATLLGPDDQVALSLRHEPDATRFGVVRVAGDRVQAFAELGDTSGGLINGGVYVVRRQVALSCPQKGSFERDVLPALARAGGVRGRAYDGFFLDIGVPEALAAAQVLLPEVFRQPGAPSTC